MITPLERHASTSVGDDAYRALVAKALGERLRRIAGIRVHPFREATRP